jgi:hypothetical protein
MKILGVEFLGRVFAENCVIGWSWTEGWCVEMENNFILNL